MVPRRRQPARRSGLPARLRPLFWDYDFAALNRKEDRDLVTARVLASGDWQTLRWLRRRLGDPALRAWIRSRGGRGLTPRQLRYWELILELPHREVNAWLADEARQIWDRRLQA